MKQKFLYECPVCKAQKKLPAPSPAQRSHFCGCNPSGQFAMGKVAHARSTQKLLAAFGL